MYVWIMYMKCESDGENESFFKLIIGSSSSSSSLYYIIIVDISRTCMQAYYICGK